MKLLSDLFENASVFSHGRALSPTLAILDEVGRYLNVGFGILCQLHCASKSLDVYSIIDIEKQRVGAIDRFEARIPGNSGTTILALSYQSDVLGAAQLCRKYVKPAVRRTIVDEDKLRARGDKFPKDGQTLRDETRRVEHGADNCKICKALGSMIHSQSSLLLRLERNPGG